MNFKYIPLTGSKHKVFIAGDFNNWNPEGLELTETNGLYKISLELEQGRYEYKFIVDGNWTIDDSADEFSLDKFGNRNSVVYVGKKPASIEQKAAEFETPDWVKDGIIYQILTDRFCNGNHKIDPDFSEWYYQKENKLSPAAREGKFKFIDDWYNTKVLNEDKNRHYLFYGGDLEGVQQKIDYLKDLGITIIYFNPLVQAASNHKYEAYDYFKIDPHFGSNTEFTQLVKDFHQNGIKVIVDFAFNHVGVGFFAFQDCLIKGEQSKYFNWFDWHKWPIPDKITESFDAKEYYQCWWGHSIMPDLNFDLDREHPDENYIKDQDEANINEDVVKYILDVAEFWLKEFDIDGFRLDIPNEVPFWFWKLFRRKVRSIKPYAYLVGEIWHNASEWVTQEYFDAVMNYNYFKDPVYDFFIGNSSAEDFADIIKTGLQRYPVQATQVMMNLLDSHDTFRFLESAGGNIRKLKLAVLFQMTFVGVPHIFYGDEIAMMGGHDPDNRRPFNWKFKNSKDSLELRNWYKKLIMIRKDNIPLRRGYFEFICAEDNIIIYKRTLKEKDLIIIINNNSDVKKLDFPLDSYIDIITETKLTKKFIPAMSGMILQKK
ncbi:MAG: alpha-amylase family glycosyl hydrolase [Candidatus Cloacimonetes bacterium]|jgi:cyclomaltodextrinase|nr:alpha-amylase family glycosyl hydrolase [Candidatus Cloacimonadota bacterium]